MWWSGNEYGACRVDGVVWRFLVGVDVVRDTNDQWWCCWMIVIACCCGLVIEVIFWWLSWMILLEW
jgi:hypothetical protein